MEVEEEKNVGGASIYCKAVPTDIRSSASNVDGELCSPAIMGANAPMLQLTALLPGIHASTVACTLPPSSGEKYCNKNSDLYETNMADEIGESRRKRFAKGSLIALGTLSVGMGIIGIVLPVLPTTPFLLLAAACYAKSSDRFYNWLIGNRLFGEYIHNYREGNGIPLRVKLLTISFLWVTILVSSFLFISSWLIRVLLLLIAVVVTLHIVLIRAKG